MFVLAYFGRLCKTWKEARSFVQITHLKLKVTFRAVWIVYISKDKYQQNILFLLKINALSHICCEAVKVVPPNSVSSANNAALQSSSFMSISSSKLTDSADYLNCLSVQEIHDSKHCDWWMWILPEYNLEHLPLWFFFSLQLHGTCLTLLPFDSPATSFHKLPLAFFSVTLVADSEFPSIYSLIPSNSPHTFIFPEFSPTHRRHTLVLAGTC